jgi:hypothetical protein
MEKKPRVSSLEFGLSLIFPNLLTDDERLRLRINLFGLLSNMKNYLTFDISVEWCAMVEMAVLFLKP